MIRPYVAVLKDSFREALASRVLWIAVFGIVLLLAALLPFGLRTDVSQQLRQHEVADAEEFLMSLQAGSEQTGTPASHLWVLMGSDNQKKVRSLLQPPATANAPTNRRTSSLPREIVRLVNPLLKSTEFYDPQAWSGVRLSRETRRMVDQSGADQAKQQHRNLQLLAAAFPDSIRLQADPAMTLTYAGTDVFGPIDTMLSQFRRVLDQQVITVLSLFLGFVGLSCALLVSASIIPRTYEPGEISLLLSKPVSRSMLFVTKFIGGCVFTLLCATLLVVGVWLILGLRLQFWRIELLWCIPIYVFLFAVYYSVAAVTGVIWRNAVVSLILTAIFWATLFSIGTARTMIDENVIKARRITEVTVAGEDVFIVDGSHSVRRWNSEQSIWQEVFVLHGQRLPRVLRRMIFPSTRLKPVYDAGADRILALHQEPARFGTGPSALFSGTEDGNWEREPEGLTPETVLGMAVDSTGRVILPGRRAIYQFAGQTVDQKKAQSYFGGILGGLMRAPSRDIFPQLQAESLPTWSASAVTALNLTDDALLVFSDGILHRLDRQEDGRWKLGISRDLNTKQPGVLAAAGQHVLLALEDGRILILKQETLESTAERQLPADVFPRVADAATDGSRLALLNHDGSVLVFDSSIGQFADWNPPEQGSAAAIAFDAQHRLIVSDGRQQLAFYENNQVTPVKTTGTADGWVMRLYDYVIRPLYWLLPKPAEMDDAVTYLVTGDPYISSSPSDTGLLGPAPVASLQREHIRFNIWTPVWSNGLFIAAMLAVGCIYVSRRDF